MDEGFDKWFEPVTAMQAEGARIGFATCKVCGASVMIDPRDRTNRPYEHAKWHEQTIIPAPTNEDSGFDDYAGANRRDEFREQQE